MGHVVRAVMLGSLSWVLVGCGDSGGKVLGTPADAAVDSGAAPPVDAQPGPDQVDAQPGPDQGRPASRFTSVGPLRARFTGIVATPTAVFAATDASVRRSRDGGDTWTLVRLPDLRGVTAMVASGRELFVAAERGALYHSVDDGETWQRKGGGMYAAHLSVRGSDVYMLAEYAPYRWNASAQTWEALEKESVESTLGFDTLESDGTVLYAGQASRGGVFRLDLAAAGAKWRRVQIADPAQPVYARAFAFFDGEGFAAGMPMLRRGAADVWAPMATQFDQPVDLLVDRGTLYLAAADGLHVSADKGATWTRLVSDQFTSSTAVAALGDTLFAAGTAVWRKRRDGVWEALDLRADRVRLLHATSGSILSTSDSGILRWEAGHWETVAGLKDDRVWPLTSIVDHGGEVLAATTHILASVDGGRSFVSRSALQGRLNFIASTPGGLLAGVESDNNYADTFLHRSTDGARTWVSLPPVGKPAHFGILDFDGLVESQGALFLLGATSDDSNYRSLDQGQTWSELATDREVGRLRRMVTAGNVLLAAGAVGGVVRSTDRGETWQRSGLDGLPVSSVVVRDAVVFAGVGGTQSFAGGVYLSTDLGRTWTLVDPTFDARVSALAVQGDRIFAGTLDHATWAAPLP